MSCISFIILPILAANFSFAHCLRYFLNCHGISTEVFHFDLVNDSGKIFIVIAKEDSSVIADVR